MIVSWGWWSSPTPNGTEKTSEQKGAAQIRVWGIGIY